MRGNEGSREQMKEVPKVVWTRKWEQGSVYLRGDVVGGSTEGARGVTLEHALPAHPKVSYLYVALAVKQHIIQL